MAGELHELKLVVTVDKKTGELKVIDSELKEVSKSQKELEAQTKKGADATENITQKTLGWRSAMRVLLPAFGVGVIANFFKGAAMEAAKMDKETTKALKDSGKMWDNLKVTIGQGFLPVLKLVPAVVEGIVNAFTRLRAGVEGTIVVLAKLIPGIGKHIDLQKELVEIEEKRKKSNEELTKGEVANNEETIKARQKLVEAIDKLTKDKYTLEKEGLDKEIKAAVEAGVEAETIAKYKSVALKDIKKRETDELLQEENERNEKTQAAYEDAIDKIEASEQQKQELLAALKDEGLEKELARVQTELDTKLNQINLLMIDEQAKAELRVQTEEWATKKKAKTYEDYLKKKYNLEKWSGSAIDILTTQGADNQKVAIWGLVEEEAKSYAKRQALAAALALAQGNFAQAAIAASQIAVSLGIANYAAGEKEKTKKEADERKIRAEERLREDERRVIAQEEAAKESAEIENNKTQYAFDQGQLSTEDYIAFLKKKQSAFKAYTSEWMSLQGQIEKAEDGRTSAIQKQAKEAANLRGEIKGGAVKTEQKQITNYYTINVNANVQDIRSVEERYLRDFATRLLPYLKQQEGR